MPTAPPPAPTRGPVLSPADSWAGHHHHPFPPAVLLVQTPPKLHQPAEPACQLNFPQSFFRWCKFLLKASLPLQWLRSPAGALVPPLVRRQIRESDLLTTKQKHPKSDRRNTQYAPFTKQSDTLEPLIFICFIS